MVGMSLEIQKYLNKAKCARDFWLISRLKMKSYGIISEGREMCELMGEAHRSSASSLSPSSWRGRKLEHKLAIPYSLDEKEREQWGESEPWTILRATSKTGRAAQIRDEGEGERRRWREAGEGDHGEGDPDTEGNVETGGRLRVRMREAETQRSWNISSSENHCSDVHQLHGKGSIKGFYMILWILSYSVFSPFKISRNQIKFCHWGHLGCSPEIEIDMSYYLSGCLGCTLYILSNQDEP